MADHINISERNQRQSDWARIVEVEKLKVEVIWAEKRADAMVRDLEAIFTRIGRGDTVQLHYENGTMIEVSATPSDTHEVG
jgi:hypothetical protein